MASLSLNAYQENEQMMDKMGIPNWSEDTWRRLTKMCKFAANVSVTFNDFYNKPHEDQRDANSWTYGIFAYIDRKTGMPIPPPSGELGHGMMFPQQACLVDFVHANGIIEILWQTTKFTHYTTKPPLSLRSNKSWTHFGCSFQINKYLAKVAESLKDSSDDEILSATLCKRQKYGS